MGNRFGKGNGRGEANGSSSSSSSRRNPKMEELSPDLLTSYQKSCEFDPELLSFDKELQSRVSLVLQALAASYSSRECELNGDHQSDPPPATLSFDTLKQVTTCLLDIDQRVVSVVLACKMDVWKNPQLFSLVTDYLDSSVETLDFCGSLEKCLRKARDSLFVLQIAVKRFSPSDIESAETARRELRAFTAAESPFSDEFFVLLRSVRTRQLQMLFKLEEQRLLLDKKIKQVKTWRKVANMIFATAFAAVIICSVVAAALSAPPVIAAITSAAASAAGSVPVAGGWFGRLWKGYEDAVKEQKEVASAMRAGTYIVIGDLDGIQALVEKAESDISSVAQTAKFSLVAAGDDGGDGELLVGIPDMVNKLEALMSSMGELGDHVNRCRRDVEKARTVVLRKIIKPPLLDQSLPMPSP